MTAQAGVDDSLAPLYPPAAHELLVAERLAVKGFKTTKVVGQDRPVDGTPDYGDRLLAELVSDADGHDGDRLAFIDKLFPHSRYDSLLLVTGPRAPCSFADLLPATQRAVLHLLVEFVDFVSRPETIDEFGLHDGRFHACWNFDRRTCDRENSMFFDKRFHLHLNYWPGRDVSLDVRRLGSLSQVAWRHRLVDPVAFLAPQIMFDALGGALAGLRLLEPDPERDARFGLPPGLKLVLDDWRQVGSERLAAALVDLHTRSAEVYAELVLAFTGSSEPVDPWTRPRLLPARQIHDALRSKTWLSTPARAGLEFLASTLRDVPSSVMRGFRDAGGQLEAATLQNSSAGARRGHTSARVRHLALADLDYNLGFFSPGVNAVETPLGGGGPVYVVVNYKLFADIGGAGLPPMGNVPIVRIVRGAEPLDPAEVAARSRLHRRFIEIAAAALREPVAGGPAWTTITREAARQGAGAP